MVTTTLEVTEHITIKRSGTGTAKFWEFNDDDAAAIYDALKKHYEPEG